MSEVYAVYDHQARAVSSVAAAGPVLSAIIAKIEALIVQFGPSILGSLPVILSAAGVPAFLQPVIIQVATMLAAWKSPAPVVSPAPAA